MFTLAKYLVVSVRSSSERKYEYFHHKKLANEYKSANEPAFLYSLQTPSVRPTPRAADACQTPENYAKGDYVGRVFLGHD